MSPISPTPSFALVAVLAISTLTLQLGCFAWGEPDLTPEDLAWAQEDLTSVAVIDAKNALVTSRSGSIYRTTDGAQTFRLVHSDAGVALHDISMVDKKHGWAVGEARILATLDGGQTWVDQSAPGRGDRRDDEDEDKDEDQGEDRVVLRLRGVHGIDRLHVLAVGLGGVRLSSENGGREWVNRSTAFDMDSFPSLGLKPRQDTPPTEPSFDADLYDVFCSVDGGERCISLGSLGGNAVSLDRGKTWTSAMRESPVAFDPIRMKDAEATVSEASLARLKSLVELQTRGRMVSIQIEAVASDTEIAEIGHARDPEALFEILDARALDVASALEEAGFASDRIRVRGAPVWSFEEMLDDDPDFLERYWRARADSEPGVYVYVTDDRVMYSGASFELGQDLAAPSSVILAVGSDGATWESRDGGLHWRETAFTAPAEMRSVAVMAQGMLSVGTEHAIQILDVGQGSWRPASLGPDLKTSHRAGVSLSDVDFSPDGGLGLVVGDSGTLLRFDALTPEWRPVEILER